MEKTYNFKDFEPAISDLWQQSGVFSPEKSNAGGKPFSIVMPPPNVTGVLHMGHALNNTIQDVIARYKRMQGFETAWIPGSDHAGIATQQVMEKRLAAQGASREQLGRDEFIKKTMELSDEHRGIIARQLQKLGSSCDWSRECFTLDAARSRAVREAFVTLYERGLIYRGDYLVNWSVGAGTALSDDEVEYKDVQGFLYTVFYPFEDGNGGIEIATTRPETMLGDTAVAVHPEDARYARAVGRRVLLPLSGRSIPVVADEYVKPEFGTGAVKITPAHDRNDYELGKRHNLPRINILNRDGTINEAAPEPYRGLSVKQARARVVADLREAGLLRAQTPHSHSVGHCYRTGTVIEPLLSAQWFVKMDGMAAKALSAWKRGDVVFHPKHWENTFEHWLSTIRDWCISRQLWWGHRIPAWYNEAGDIFVLREDPSPEDIAARGLRQETDVLDTWFSSWLWPFSVFGWPQNTDDLKKFYPTSVLVTAYDIIFFWVARMVMAGLEFMDAAPFKDVYIHGLVRDDKGRKMSKSLGNGIDPLVIADKYGADALKFTLSFLCKLGTDVLINEESFQLGSRFANKAWNASRFVLMNIEHTPLDEKIVAARVLPSEARTDADEWLLTRLARAAQDIARAMDAYRLDEAARRAYEYFWQDFCDWYVEASKAFLASENAGEQKRAASVLLWFLRENLKLLHPFMPFVTEEIYRHVNAAAGLKDVVPDSVLAAEGYPSAARYGFTEASLSQEKTAHEAQFAALQELVGGVRALRSEFGIPPKLPLPVSVRAERADVEAYFARHAQLIASLANVELRVPHNDSANNGAGNAANNSAAGVGIGGAGFSASVYIKESIDVEAERKRLQNKLEKLGKQRAALTRQLEDPRFAEKASADYVAQVQEQDAQLREAMEKTTRFLQSL